MTVSAPIRITINGRQIEAVSGRMLIDVAEELDIFVPRFCYHPGMESVAACRMCLVEVEGAKKLQPACATPVSDGMVIRTDSEPALEAQRSVLELLLINHPLDCPICDRGGECPLQDQALTFGPGSSRYEEEKRHFPKPIPISRLVMLDRERCVLCWRCVRFCDEVSGDSFIELVDRGSLTQINVAEDEPFDSYFSGNTIQICPVGALTSRPYRFVSRPWDLQVASTVCSFCAVGCPLSLERRGGEVLRAQALPNEHVNSFWNCDKGRFGHRYVSHRDRLRTPLVRRRDESGEERFADASWDEALSLVADRLRSAIGGDGPESVGFIGGSHETNEDLFAAARFFRQVVGTPNLDVRTFDAGFPYPRLAGEGIAGSSACLDDLDHARTILWFGPDPKEELPVLYLRLRKAALKGAKLVVAHPRRISLSGLGLQLRYVPGRAAELAEALAGVPVAGPAPAEPSLIDEAREALASGPAVVCAGQQFVGLRADRAADALAGLAERLGARVLVCVPNANSQGAVDMGVFPGLAPGHRPAPLGLDTGAMLRAAAGGRLRFLYVMGADLVTDFPDARMARAALSSHAFVVVSELFPTETALAADVVLPASSFAEKEGSYTNLERRIQKLNPVVPSPGIARADWQVLGDLALRLGHSWGWRSAGDVAEEIAAAVPTHEGFSWDRLADSPARVSLAVAGPPEAGHSTGESGPGTGLAAPERPLPLAGASHSTTSWPLRWELRAVDATRRRGWVPIAHAGAPAAPAPGIAAGRTPVPPETVGPGNPASGTPAGAPAELGREAAGVGAGAGRHLVLLVSRGLYDAGQMVSRAPDLADVTPRPFVELHPAEAAARGLAGGQEVTVRSPRGSVRTVLRVSEDTPPGAAFMLFDQPGLQANVLLDARLPLTLVEVSR